MPRIIKVEGVPMMAQHASDMMASHLRLRIIRYFGTNPGSQSDAAAALSVPNSSLTKNVHALVDLGVLRQGQSEADSRAYVYSVDHVRVRELMDAAADYLIPARDAGQEPAN